MTKAGKTKKFRQLKKRIRKTLGTLFLVSAIAVAAIPVENLQAQITGTKVSADLSNIPTVGSGEKIYTTGDGIFQFAYVNDNSGANKVAVILGYQSGYLSNGNLTLPNTVDAYSKYTDSQGTAAGYVAVGQNGAFLFYSQDIITGYDDSNSYTDINSGQYIEVLEPIYKTEYYPCYYSTYATWSSIDTMNLYYMPVITASPGDAASYRLVGGDSSYQRLKDAQVTYIGKQYLTGNSGEWVVAGLITESSQGIFANNANIVSLSVGNNLKGIGDYAFYYCVSLSSITLSNALQTLGNYAFANCMNVTSVNLAVTSNVQVIGAYAFYNCTGLASFTVPTAVQKIGDYAFAGCQKMTTLSFGNGNNVALTDIGDFAFMNCSSLASLDFPDTFTAAQDNGAIPISLFKGCNKLKSITVRNSSVSFVNDTGNGYTIENFKANVPADFYFEGNSGSKLHNLANDNSIAFKYLNENIYEIIITDKTTNKKATYRVDSNNTLLYCNLEPGIAVVELPETIGPYGIKKIGAGSFQGNMSIKKITIPSSVTEIEANAFKSCINLNHVIFTEPVNITSIGTDAFFTQSNITTVSGNATTTPELTFTGPIDVKCAAFNYAMNENNYINDGMQVRTYIKYYSGWPENLVVQHNNITGKNELIDYPTLESLGYYASSNYPYMTTDYAQAASEALNKYLAGSALKDYEQEIIDSALNIVLPEGIESIQSGLFIRKEKDDNQFSFDKAAKTLTTYGIEEIAANSFEGFTNLKSVYIYGNTTKIGDYAFKDCINLEEAVVSATVQDIGLRPFAGCPKLTSVDFQGSPYFVCDKAIIFKLSGGEKKSVVQCLEARGALLGSSSIADDELSGITEIAKEAFRDCKSIGSVNLTKSKVTTIPDSAFRGTSMLYSVYLPGTCTSISDYAFFGSKAGYLEIPSSVSYISPYAFDTNKFSENGSYSTIEFYCVDESSAYYFAQNHSNISTRSMPLIITYDVYFWDGEIPANLLDQQTVIEGDDAIPPEAPEKEGYTFKGWSPDYHEVARTLDVVAQYTPIDPDTTKYKVTFIDWDESVIVTRLVSPGDDAEAPVDPVRAGYTFDGWRPKITDIQENTLTYAQYTPRDSIESEHVVRFIDHDDTILYTQRVKDGEDAILPQSPTRTGYTFIKWQPDIKNITKDLDTYARYEKGDGSGGDGDGNGNGDPTSKFYTLTVRNGSGSGSYAAGAQVIIYANDPASGQVFDKWSLEPTATAIASTSVPATVLTMPEAAVTVTANFKTDGSTASSNTSTSNTSTSNTSSTPRNYSSASGNTSNTGVVNNAGNTSNTSLVIDKNGISNTGVASATVNGSSDDFVIKITESASATDAVVKALMYEYGDLTNIKYFPMDISLYDSTGTNKITDTTGLSISITIPIPDSLITYAGNNKAAGVVDEKLDKLSAKFTTISGVSCITFTAEHFSPYAIYVDTANLTAGTVSDDTPSTGDGIHPKWFLSIGLACISMILFMKKDKRNTKKRMVTA